VEQRYITDTSLRDYLATAVPDYIAHKTEFRDRQTPWASLSCPKTFYLHTLAKPTSAEEAELPQVQLELEDMELRRVETGAIRSLPGFKKGKHFVPDSFHSRVDDFIGRSEE